jgi:hypothetical protein
LYLSDRFQWFIAQEQRETLLAYFFLHFRWTGAEDNRFEKREPGAAMIAMGGRVI